MTEDRTGKEGKAGEICTKEYAQTEWNTALLQTAFTYIEHTRGPVSRGIQL